MLFELSNPNSNLALTLGYLNPALNNSALISNRIFGQSITVVSTVRLTQLFTILIVSVLIIRLCLHQCYLHVQEVIWTTISISAGSSPGDKGDAVIQTVWSKNEGSPGPPGPLSWIRHRLYLTKFSDHFSLGGSRPSDKGGARPWGKVGVGGAVSKLFFSALRVSF